MNSFVFVEGKSHEPKYGQTSRSNGLTPNHGASGVDFEFYIIPGSCQVRDPIILKHFLSPGRKPLSLEAERHLV